MVIFHSFLYVYPEGIYLGPVFSGDLGWSPEAIQHPIDGELVKTVSCGCTDGHWSMDWFKGKFTGKPHIVGKSMVFPIKYGAFL